MAKKGLRISKTLSLPIDALTQRFAFLARTGAGKSYAAGTLAEEFLKAKLQIAVVDPQGAWWGLRSSADGKGPGYPILIMGGDHGDVPLEPTAGALVADLIIETGLSVILDLSKFETDAEEIRFVTAFVDRLFRKNRHPIHLFFDEGDTFAPQTPMREENLMLNRMARLAKRGRSKGIGMSLISQRSAAISKRVLSQTEIMIAMQTTDPRDKKAIAEWMRGKGSEEAQKEVLDMLPSLKIGEAWVWSPAFLSILKRLQIRAKRTFDSSATPKVGARKRVAKVLAEVDIEKLKTQMSETIEKANQEDPKILKARIRELEAKVRSAGDTKLVTDLKKLNASEADRQNAEVRIKALTDEVIRLKKKKIQVVERLLLPPKDLLRMENIAQSLKTHGGKIADQASNIRGHADRMQKEAQAVDRRLKTQDALMETVKKAAEMPPLPPPVRRPVQMVRTREGFRGHVAGRPTATPKDDLKLRAGEKAILQAVYSLGGSGSVHQVGALSGFPAGGDTFKTYRNRLKRFHLVTVEEGVMTLTDLGTMYVPDTGQTAPRTTEEMVEFWNGRLRKGERDMLNFLVSVRGMKVSRDTIMKEAGINSDTTYKTYRNVLIRNQLAELFPDEQVSAHPTLFPELAHA
jgi:hypothetical protein